MSEIAEKKQQLRSTVLNRRNAISTHIRAEADEQVQAHLQSLSIYQEAKTVFCYVSVDSEVNTRALIEEMLEEGKTVCSPRCIGGGIMHAHKINSVEELNEGALGIPAPDESAPIIDPNDIDLVIVPCITCSRDGWRLGYGGGYYDRYLKDVHKAKKVIICKHELLADDLPKEIHDVHADMVITDKEIFIP